MRLSEHQREFSLDIAKLIIKAEELGIGLTFGEAYRTEYQQEEYVATGKSKTMDSNHLKRLAVDFNFFIDGKLTYDKYRLSALGYYWISLNKLNQWGGFYSKFVDTPHFERRV